MAFGYIKAIGLEVEGPFRSQPKSKEYAKINGETYEGHIQEFKDEYMPPTKNVEAQKETKYYRECVSDILRFPKHVEDFFDEMRPHYVDKGVGPGMGFHIHFSLTEKKYYDLLLSKHFNSMFFAELFGQFASDNELQARPKHRSDKGTNFFVMEHPDEYFLHVIPKKNHGTDSKERYYGINFWRAYSDHGTYEIRIFPANTIPKMMEYVNWTIQFINKYIDDNMGNDEVTLEVKCAIEVQPEPEKPKKFAEEIEVKPRKNVRQLQGHEIPWRNLNQESAQEKSSIDDIDLSSLQEVTTEIAEKKRFLSSRYGSKYASFITED